MKKHTIIFTVLIALFVTAGCDLFSSKPKTCKKACPEGMAQNPYPDCSCFDPAPPPKVDPDEKLQVTLIQAAIKGNTNLITDQLVNQHLNVNARLGLSEMNNFLTFRESLRRYVYLYENIKIDMDDFTLLFLAAATRKANLVKLLLDNGADYNMISMDGLATPLKAAVMNADPASVGFLMDKGAMPNLDSEEDEENFLKIAFKNKDFGTAGILVRYAYANNIPIRHLLPDIVQAVKQKNTKLLAFLIDRTELTPNEVDIVSGEPLVVVALTDADPTTVRLITAGGGDLSWRDKNGRTPLMIYIDRSKFTVARLRAMPTILQYLADANADFEAVDNKGETALFYAVRKGNMDLLNKLMEIGVNVNAVNNSGETPIFYPATRGDTKMVNFLLANGAKAKVKNKRGKTPQQIAVEKGYMSTFSALEKSKQ